MPSRRDRRRDLFVVLLLVPVVVAALFGRARLRVDVENLSMKSVGTEAGAAEALEREAFGNRPRILVLAEPTVEVADAATDAWIAGLRAEPAVTWIEIAHPGEHHATLLAVDVRVDGEGRYAAAVDEVAERARATAPEGFELTITGHPVVEIAIAEAVARERNRVLPALVLALALVLWLVQRRAGLVAATLAGPLLAVLSLEGLQGFLGIAVDPISSLLGPSVLAVGVAAAVHVVEAYGRLAVEHGAGAASLAVRALFVPMLLTLATTVTGFLGLLASPIPAVQRFGWLASIGVAITITATVLVLPSLLRLFDRRAADPSSVIRSREPRAWRPRSIALPVFGLAAGLFLGMNGLDPEVDSDPLHVLSAEDPVRLAAEHVAEEVGGDAVFDLLLPPPGPAGPLAAAALAVRLYGVQGVAGPAGKPAVGEGDVRRVPLLLAPASSGERAATFDRAETLAREAGWERAVASGLAVRLARDSDALVVGQREGLLATTIGLFVVMSLGFRSLRLGALGLLPNLLPVAVLQGSLGLLDRPLTVASSMIGSVMLGLIVDNTIHLLHAFRRASGSNAQRIAEALHDVERPVFLTTIVLSAGFGATLLGRLGATREFGTMAIATLVIALLADLWLLPSFLAFERRRRSGGTAD